MEQKQLDELEDYTEEFIEDETPEEHMVLKAQKDRKALAIKRLNAKPAKELSDKEKELLKTAKVAVKMKVTEVKQEPIKVETYNDDEIMITPVKEELKSVKTAPPVEVSTPVNPWANEEKKNEVSGEAGFFQDVSTWQAFTGILIILLVFSIFTQGFQFKVNDTENGIVASPENKLDGTVSAENVNEVNGGQEVNIADKAKNSSEVDKTITNSESSGGVGLSKGNVSVVTVKPAVVKGSTTAQTNKTSVTNVATSASTVKTIPRQVSLGAKKWRFSSEMLTVKQNDHVILTVRPESMMFTFGIKELGVEKEVSGTTVIEFDALKKGSYTFSCSSCEEWRGMTGTLVVE